MSDHLPYVVCLRTQHSIKKVARSIKIKPTTIYLTKILMQTRTTTTTLSTIPYTKPELDI